MNKQINQIVLKLSGQQKTIEALLQKLSEFYIVVPTSRYKPNVDADGVHCYVTLIPQTVRSETTSAERRR